MKHSYREQRGLVKYIYFFYLSRFTYSNVEGVYVAIYFWPSVSLQRFVLRYIRGTDNIVFHTSTYLGFRAASLYA